MLLIRLKENVKNLPFAPSSSRTPACLDRVPLDFDSWDRKLISQVMRMSENIHVMASQQFDATFADLSIIIHVTYSVTHTDTLRRNINRYIH